MEGLDSAKREAYTAARTPSPSEALGRFEIELDLGAVRVVREELPRSRVLLPAQLVAHACGVEARLDALHVGGGERHVVDDAGALLRGLAVEVEMHERVRALAVEPCAVEAEVGPMALAQAEQADVEVERPAPVLGDDGEVVHADDHRILLCDRWRSGDE